MATKLGWMLTYLEELLPLTSHVDMITWSSEMTCKLKPLYLHHHSVYMATKLGTMVTYLERLLAVKSHDPLI